MTDMLRWNPLKIIPSFVGTDTGSVEEMEALFQSVEAINLPIMARRSDEEDVIGYASANGMLARFTPETGLMLSCIRQDDPRPYEYGYIYENPEMALSWLLCQMGFGANSYAYESEALVFHIPENQRPLRLSFEAPLNEAQIAMYANLAEAGTHVDRVQNVLYGSRLRPYGGH